MPHIDFFDFVADALFEVGNEFGAPFGDDVFDFVVQDEFRGGVPQPHMFTNACHGDDEQIGYYQFGITDRHGQAVDDRNGDDDKQVGHFANGNGFGAIANHAENGKQTKCKANLQFDVFHQENEQKHADTE